MLILTASANFSNGKQYTNSKVKRYFLTHKETIITHQKLTTVNNKSKKLTKVNTLPIQLPNNKPLHSKHSFINVARSHLFHYNTS